MKNTKKSLYPVFDSGKLSIYEMYHLNELKITIENPVRQSDSMFRHAILAICSLRHMFNWSSQQTDSQTKYIITDIIQPLFRVPGLEMRVPIIWLYPWE